MTTKQRLTIGSSIVLGVIVTVMVMTISVPSAQASHNAEPSMFVNGINAGSAHSYIYNVIPGAIDLDVALMIKDMEEKSNVQLSITDPVGVTTICPYTPAGFNLLVAECVLSFPVPGIWTLTITSGAIANNPVGYAIAADTIEDYVPSPHTEGTWSDGLEQYGAFKGPNGGVPPGLRAPSN